MPSKYLPLPASFRGSSSGRQWKSPVLARVAGLVNLRVLLLVVLLVVLPAGLYGGHRYKSLVDEDKMFNDPKTTDAYCARAIAKLGVPSSEQIRLDWVKEGRYVEGLGKNAKDVYGEVWARVVSPNELMRGDVKRWEGKIVHQSWKSKEVPGHFDKWSKGWRRLTGEDWVYVLWTDADNLELVEKYYPQYLATYNSLPREIYRADMVRNIYMHHFGGIYADLDLLPLVNIPSKLPAPEPSKPVAYVGRMGSSSYEHSIPNAWMYSPVPGHSFWLEPLDYVKRHLDEEEYRRQPEGLTGPVALRDCVKAWRGDEEVVVLTKEKIYPFDWHGSPTSHHCLCRKHIGSFNEERCEWLYPEAWAITFWTHSWG